MTAESQHYLTKCGCMYSKDSPYPWHICQMHFAKGLRLHDRNKVLKIAFKTSDFALANPATIDADISSNLKYEANQTKQHYWLYALRLNDGKYYVGMTGKSNPYYRIMAHGDFLGARWTMKHRPIELLEVRDIGRTTKEVAEDMEHRLTLIYMQIYGHRHVRGGKVTYTGRVFRIGKYFVRSNQLTGFVFTSLCLVVAGWYIISGAN